MNYIAKGSEAVKSVPGWLWFGLGGAGLFFLLRSQPVAPAPTTLFVPSPVGSNPAAIESPTGDMAPLAPPDFFKELMAELNERQAPAGPSAAELELAKSGQDIGFRQFQLSQDLARAQLESFERISGRNTFADIIAKNATLNNAGDLAVIARGDEISFQIHSGLPAVAVSAQQGAITAPAIEVAKPALPPPPKPMPSEPFSIAAPSPPAWNPVARFKELMGQGLSYNQAQKIVTREALARL